MSKRVVVTGMSVNTAIGDTLDGFTGALMAGRSAISRWTAFPTDRIYSKVGGVLSSYDVAAKLASLQPLVPADVHKRLRKLVAKVPWTTKLSMLLAVDGWQDAGLFDALFWDGRATTTFINPVTGEVVIESGGALESQAAGPPVNSAEMSCEGYSWTAIESKLAGATPLKLASQIPTAMAQAISEHPTYPSLFEWVYKTPEVTAERILFAIATYERELRSDQTPWDRFNGGDSEALTAGQQAGLAVFNVKARCAKCHVPPRFTDNRFHNIGAQLSELDPGRSSISALYSGFYMMKVVLALLVGRMRPR
jgi:hypothetical protein